MDSTEQRRPCWVEISTGAIEDNFRTLQRAAGTEDDATSSSAHTLAPVEVLAIVKADAYGHGLHLCAPAAARAGAKWLGVTSVEEGTAARKLCRAAEILVIGGPFAGQGAAVIEHRLTPVVWQPWQLALLTAAAIDAGCDVRSMPVHMEFDTGMSRQGISAAGLTELLSHFAEDSPLRLDGLMTHLYAADEADGELTRAQFAELSSMVETVFAAELRPRWLHVGNSAALLAGNALIQLHKLCACWGLLPMVRPGLALYGLVPEFVPLFGPHEPPRVTQLREDLHPVLEWKTQVVSVRSIAAGQTVGYNGTFVATEPMRVALLAVGYGDGLKRALSNCGWVLIASQRAPIIGRISMDQTTVDVTDIADVVPGQEVVLLGRQDAEAITAGDHAAWVGTVAWEILTSIATRVERRPLTER